MPVPIETNKAYYRVVRIIKRSGAQEKELVLERIEKPTTPKA